MDGDTTLSAEAYPSPAHRTKHGLPVIAESGPLRRFVFGAALTLAYLLLAVAGTRLVLQGVPGWWMAAAVVAGIAMADLVSGLVHWAADSWGSDDLPVIGPALLVPFRVHHVNPDDFQGRRVLDVNGDVALIAVPALAWLAAVDVDSPFATAAASFGAAFCAAGMLTNQIHQWAHRPKPPRAVRVLQACHVILGPVAHGAHHDRPYDRHYCITTGWWNRPLDAIGFFRSLERAISLATGAQPRGDDRRYERRYARPARRDT